MEEETKKESIKLKKTTLWQIITGVLAVLLVISIFTGGFGIRGGGASATGKLSAIIVNDERCAECDTAGLTAQLQSMIPGLEIKSYDYNSKEGKELYDTLNLGVLPALLFDEKIKEQPAFTQMERFIEPKGEYLSLKIGASFDPTKEVCNNEIDDTGDGKIDCEDPDCAGDLLCREEIKGKLDVFVMSQCPYGTKALDAMKDVFDAFGKENIDFTINYIANENPDGTFNSLHGQPEVDEDIRELCAIAHYPKKYRYMDYIWCRDKNIQSADWEACAEEAGMEASVIKECFEGEEGKKLLSENIKIADELGVSASPTWLANNNFKFSGIDAKAIQTQFCSVNAGLEGCGATINATASDVPAGSCN